MKPAKFCLEPVVCFLVLLSHISICLSAEVTEEEELHPTCSSAIYCHGRLLHTVQMAKIYEDSKTFVDMKLKKPVNETLALFDKFMKQHDDKPSKQLVTEFVHENFEEAGMEFEKWEPDDWRPDPRLCGAIADEKFREWCFGLNDIWKILGRKMKSEIEHHQELYSIVWVPHPVIVPGGRFREFYYWDSYWIVQGLLLTDMHDTARGMLENLLYIVDKHGHIPNGGRIYYLARSHPPLMIPMIKLYYDFTHNDTFLKKNIDIMEKEFTYWLTKHSQQIKVDGNEYTLALYGDRSYGPRPESYSEDVESAAVLKGDQAKTEAFYSELKAGAESGWDFSSRWFISNATNKGSLININTRSIVPVDLNAFIYWNAQLLSEFYTILNRPEKAAYYSKTATEWMQAVEAVLWHEEIGAWLDYDIINNVKRDYFYPTNIAPLWTGCYNASNKEKMVRSVLKYLQNKNILYPGGVPSTLEHTGEQWDYPNAWPPLQHIMIVGLNNTGDDHAMRLAYELSQNWIRSNYKAYTETKAMYEKYDATIIGGHGGGGEYEIQLGFGWTNGVILDLLWRYADKVHLFDPYPPPPVHSSEQIGTISATISSITAALIALLVSLTAGFIGVLIYKRRTQKRPLFGDKKRPSRAAYSELRNLPMHNRSAR